MWNACHGFMAIWSDVSPDDFDFYHHWLLKEHFQERVGVPGFIAARVFRRQAVRTFSFSSSTRRNRRRCWRAPPMWRDSMTRRR